MSVLFSADLSEDIEVTMSFTPTTDVSREYNVYDTYLGAYPSDTYWTDWGGYYDNAIINQIELYMGGQYLVRVNSLEDCCNTPFSIYDPPTAGTIYINVPKHTWLYDDVTTTYRKTVSFLSGPKNPENPSDDIFNNEHWLVRLETPKFSVKLSDAINGLTKYSTFDFTLHNDDGYFDDLAATNFFNAPSYIKKTWVENPSADDFIPIRYGIVETIKVDDKTMTISCADIFRTLEEPVSSVVKDIYKDATENVDKNLAVVYGTVNIPLTKIGSNTLLGTYTYAAGENLTDVLEVYDKDGNLLSFTKNSDNSITTSDANAKSALVVGNTNNKIGEVIVDVITSKTNIKYVNTFWDIVETDIYKINSPVVNISFTGGNVKNAVKNALSSDTVFLIQKNDGRFTLRQWGETYKTFSIGAWQITKFPTKDFDDAQNNYLSSCSIYYNYDFANKEYNDVLLYDDNEEAAEALYSKLVRKEFKTYLINEIDAFNLGTKLSNRFSTLRETVKVSVGFNTAEINLLDKIELPLDINGRKFSTNTVWIVKEIDPAQDVLVMEKI
jgi:hypothetical protein